MNSTIQFKWEGEPEKVAENNDLDIETLKALQDYIEEQIEDEYEFCLDTWVLDVLRGDLQEMVAYQDYLEEDEEEDSEEDKDYEHKIIDGLITGIERRDQKIQDLKQELEEEKRLHQKCRDGLEGWSPPADKTIGILLDRLEEAWQQVKYHEANEEALREELKEKEEQIEKMFDWDEALKKCQEASRDIQWVCLECGKEHGNSDELVRAATLHYGTCDICGEKGVAVTQPRDFGGIEYDKVQQSKVEKIIAEFEGYFKSLPNPTSSKILEKIEKVLNKYLNGD